MLTENRNPSKWKLCEITKSIEYERKGCLVVPTGKGSDFLAICLGEKPTFVEVKNGCGGLTKFQRKTRNEAEEKGLGYRIERCACGMSR